MNAKRKKIGRYLATILVMVVFVLLLGRSDIEPGDITQRAHGFTREIEFDFAGWGRDALFLKFREIALGAVDYLPPETQKQVVLNYLDLIRQISQYEGQLYEIYADPAISDPEAASLEIRQKLEPLYNQRNHLAPLAEAILQNQLTAVASDFGLTLGGQSIPPALYHVTPLPLALIISPRDTIRQESDIPLIPDLTVAQRDALENKVDENLDVSSLVVNVGGVGMYPTMVMQTTDLNWLAEVVAHEWIHNALTLRPLGASYLSSPELRIMNETAANIAGKELGAALIERFYPEFAPPPPAPTPAPEESAAPTSAPEPPAFDFQAEMYETRVHVDELLAAGAVDEAEAYMETRRQFFWENGYHIRKLNQAFFAFHGAYADMPGGAAGAQDPVGPAVRALRAQSGSLVEFIRRISWMWKFEQLQAAVENS
ncbi:MAG TPA: hypothetical protein DEH25_16335 [Chloroflexi bacterium]|nr:hypothetical protein [Chloroflexota bacterium]